MKARTIGSNQTEIEKGDGTLILVSYETPVAAVLPNGDALRTNRFYSVTTSRHINKWLGRQAKGEVVEVSPEKIDL